MREVEAGAVQLSESAEQVVAVTKSITSLTDGNHGVDLAAVVTNEESGQSIDTLVIVALEGDHWEIQSADLEGCRLFFGMPLWAERRPRRQGLLEGSRGQWTEDARKGHPAHSFRLCRRVLENSRRRPEGLQGVLIVLCGSDVRQLDATEGQHRQDDRQRHLTRLPRSDENQKSRPVGALKDEVAAHVVERVIFSFGIINRNCRPVMHNTGFPDLRGRVLHLRGPNAGCDT
mmetsp:Transcript_116791/g.164171  ORF Transcript_116791/g.164171 Transcript_116791/m.164171 type:complete len:231 (+) Transcript_116791:1475-2167(+)